MGIRAKGDHEGDALSPFVTPPLTSSRIRPGDPFKKGPGKRPHDMPGMTSKAGSGMTREAEACGLWRVKTRDSGDILVCPHDFVLNRSESH